MDDGREIELVEYQPKFLPQDILNEEEASKLDTQYKGILDIQPPSYKNHRQWVITPLGYIGFIPFPGNRKLVVRPKIRMGNIFRMLDETYDPKIFRLEDKAYNAETIQDFFEHIAMLLANMIIDRSRQDLYKAYKNEEAELPYIRGRINIPAMSHKPIFNNLDCQYEDHTMDVAENRIIAWTIHSILQRHTLSSRALQPLQQIDRMLKGNIALQFFTSHDAKLISYHRLNDDYEKIHLLCRLFLDNLAPGLYTGNQGMIPFLIRTDKLFERYVALWLQRNIGNDFRVVIQDPIQLDGYQMLQIKLDVAIYRNGENVPSVILDTKYKIHETVTNPDAFQMMAYNVGTGCDKAILVYPIPLKTQFKFKRERCSVYSICFDVSAENLIESGNRFLNELLPIISS